MDSERLSVGSHARSSGGITIETKIIGTRVIATLNVGIGTGRFTYTVQFADQGNDAANEAEAQRKLRETLEEVVGALVDRGEAH